MTRDDDARREFNRAAKHAEQNIGLIEPTEDEKRNGWTAETLTAYVRDQAASAEMRVDPHSAMRRKTPKRANSKYSPFKWRGR